MQRHVVAIRSLKHALGVMIVVGDVVVAGLVVVVVKP